MGVIHFAYPRCPLTNKGSYTLPTRRRIANGIVQIMELWRCYKLVRFIYKKTGVNRRYDEEGFVLISIVRNKHKWWFRRFTTLEVRQIITNAFQSGYIEPYQDGNTIRLAITAKGVELQDFPVGTAETFLGRYSKLTGFLFGVAGTGVLVLLWNFIRSIL